MTETLNWPRLETNQRQCCIKPHFQRAHLLPEGKRTQKVRAAKEKLNTHNKCEEVGDKLLPWSAAGLICTPPVGMALSFYDGFWLSWEFYTQRDAISCQNRSHSVSLCGNVVPSPSSCPSETFTVAIHEESLEAMHVWHETGLLLWLPLSGPG